MAEPSFAFKTSIMIVVISFFPLILSNNYEAAAESLTYIDGGISMYGGSHFKDSPTVFVHGDVVQFNGWTDSHRDGKYGIADTSNATFTIDIIGPNKEVVYHTAAKTDETGNAYFSLPIADSFAFGTYLVSYSLEKEGFVGITPYSEGPDVSYYESRFFVTWTEEDVIDASDEFKLELSYEQNNAGPVQFGSAIELEGKLCPSSHIQKDTYQSSYVTQSGAILFDGPGSVVVTGHFLPAGSDDDSTGGLAAQDVSVTLSENSCSTPFDISSGVLWTSGNWSVTADAYWMQENDLTHVLHAENEKPLTFEVMQTQYRSDDITPIKLDPAEYPEIVPMDWSPDDKSILFSYLEKRDDGSGIPRLAILTLADMTVRTLDTDFGNNAEVTGYPIPYGAKYSANGGKLVLLLDSDLYSYDLASAATTKLTDSGGIASFDVAPDGRLLYTSSRNLAMADSDGKNPNVVFSSDTEYEIFAADIAQDGKKILYRKVVNASYGWQDAVLAYYDIDERKEHIVPDIHNGCGSPPKWAPNGYHLAFHESSCSRGWPGGILTMTDLNGSFQEYIVPGSNDNPAYFVFNPDGSSMIIGFTYSGSATGGAVDKMGGPASFYLVNFAKPVPEFGSVAIMLIAAGMFGSIVAARHLQQRWKG